MKIELKGVQFVNKGAELMLYACIEMIAELWPGAEIVLSPGRHSPYLKRARLGAWQKLNLRKHVLDINGLTYLFPEAGQRLLHSYGLVTEADVDLVLDASGFAYGDQWPVRQLQHTSRHVSRMAAKGKPYIFLSQALGPFNNPTLQASLNQHWHNAALIVARDEESHDTVAKYLKHTDTLVRYPDFTNLLSPEGFDDIEAPGLLVIPNSKMLSKRNQRKDWFDAYMPHLTEICQQALNMGVPVTLLNHDGGNDGQLCQDLNQALGGNAKVITLDCPLAVKALIGKATAVVSSRFHGCVSALSQGVPCIGTSWSHKYEALFADYGVSDMLLSSPNTDLLAQMLAELLNPEYADKVAVNPAIAQQKAAARAMWQQVAAVVADSRGVK